MLESQAYGLKGFGKAVGDFWRNGEVSITPLGLFFFPPLPVSNPEDLGVKLVGSFDEAASEEREDEEAVLVDGEEEETEVNSRFRVPPLNIALTSSHL